MDMQEPHAPNTCQVCDMFENVSLWGPPMGKVPRHLDEPWPDEVPLPPWHESGDAS